MRIAVRVDASQAIGTGHVKRTAALAASLKECGAEVRFICRDLGMGYGTLVPQEAVLATLPCPALAGMPAGSGPPYAAWLAVGWEQDCSEALSIFASADWYPDWIIVDHYGIDASWHDAMRARSGAKIAVIDDLADRPLSADLIIDHNYHPDHHGKYTRIMQRICPVLGGVRFALLGPAFATAPKLEVGTDVASIGVFMGGVDAAGMSMTALDAIDMAGFSGPVEVVSTSQNPHLAALRDRVARRPDTTLSIDLPDLASFFARHQAQIGAGGGATWERCCIGVPTILISVADNQQAVIPELARHGVILAASPGDSLIAAIARLIGDTALRQDMAARSQDLVDGLGARRVALALTRDALAVRPATQADARMMWLWRNHPATRGVSRSPDPIAWESHLTWLEARLSCADCCLMIGQVGTVPVGVIRFDRSSAGQSCEVSLYLDPALHGLGLGRCMLAAGERAAFQDCDIDAEVLPGNLGSERLFLAGGYAPISQVSADGALLFRKSRSNQTEVGS